jgi:uncharacterized protein RhaS with RHS repeats
MYDPKIGKWISADPIGFEGEDANLYRYVNSQPTSLVDPNGWQQRTAPPGYGSRMPAPGSNNETTIGYWVSTHLLGRLIQLYKFDDNGYLLYHRDTGGEFESAFRTDMRTIVRNAARDYLESHSIEPCECVDVYRHFESVQNPSSAGWRWISNRALDAGWWLNGAHRVDAEIKFRLENCGEEIMARDVQSRWDWHDEIDARSVKEWWNAKDTWWETIKGIPNGLVESVFWDWVVDGLLDADFPIHIATDWIKMDDFAPETAR